MDKSANPMEGFRSVLALYCILTSMMFLSSCSKGVPASNDGQRISFLKKYNISVDTMRPYYSSQISVPNTFNAIWEMRNIFSKDLLGIDMTRFKGKKCSIFMYPVSKLPFDIKKSDAVETRAVVISCRDRIICSYIDFILEIRSIPPVSLKGRNIAELSGTGWDVWKSRMDGDDNKRIVIWQYCDALKLGNYEEAYSYIYDKSNITKEEFINTASKKPLHNIDFLGLEQSGASFDDECRFTAKANIVEGGKNKTREIVFNLKKDPTSKEYGGWKIYSANIK